MKVTPKPKFKKQGVDFAELAVTDWFIYNNMLCVKVDEGYTIQKQTALDVVDAHCIHDMCSEYVLPVEVEIKWKRK